MVRPPRMVYSAVVSNETGEALTLHVVYRDHHKNTESFDFSLAAGAKLTLEEKELAEGSCTYAKEISDVTVKSASGLSHSLSAPFNVDAPTRDHPFTVKKEHAALAIHN